MPLAFGSCTSSATRLFWHDHSMGGPCFLVEENDSKKPGPKNKKIPGPACTDNFQIAQFKFEGKEWHSVEQAYQGYKFPDGENREKIRSTLPNEGESSFDYGQRVWRLGQQGESKRTEDGVELMFKLCAAKLQHNPGMHAELVATGSVVLHGGPSTGEWTTWNGLIQTRLRKELSEGTFPSGLEGGTLLEALRAAEPQLLALGLIKE